MSRPIADLIGREICTRFCFSELTPNQRKKYGKTISQEELLELGNNCFEPCFVIYGEIILNLNRMTESPEERIPEGWDGRQGDIIFRLIDQEDCVEVGRIQR